MSYEYKTIESISPEELDDYLAIGWFRLGQKLITLDEFLSSFYYWLRVNMSIVSYNKSQKRVLKKAQHFDVSVSDWEINYEIDLLWSRYKQGINFEISPTATDNLFGDEMDFNLFNTKRITVRDQEMLIAVGYFDIGKTSSSSILHFYDPEYKSYSLGKLLLLLEMEYAKENGIDFYYTGYLALFNTKYDYKLFCGKDATEVYIKEEDRWEPYRIAKSKGLLEKVEDPFDDDDDFYIDYDYDDDDLFFTKLDSDKDENDENGQYDENGECIKSDVCIQYAEIGQNDENGNKVKYDYYREDPF